MKDNKLNGSEKNQVWGCYENIQDKLNAIREELIRGECYKSYILEKIESVCWDSNCIKAVCEDEQNNDN